MDKDKVLFGIIGLLAGCIIGFLFANNLNQNQPVQSASIAPTTTGNMPPANPNLPPDHPQLGNNPNAPTGAPLAEVTEALKKAEAQPTDFKAQLDVGDLYYQIQRYDEAAKFYERAGKIRPDSLEVLVKAGNAYFDAEKFETAEKWYVAALAKNPGDANVRTDLGLTFYLRNPPDVDRAIKEYEISLENNPNHELTLQNLVVALREKGDAKATQETSDRLAKINPNNPVLKSK
ncbi:MAG: tetratricopeptide repeat protein [Pyrinomonadaceae bacterium]|nr:tetratricopeptide repeat protein [Pyrinomonadaceae bacterium]